MRPILLSSGSRRLPAGLISLALVFCAPMAWAQCTGSIFLGNDTTLCDGQTLLLSPGPGYLSYLWDDNSTDATRMVGQEGTYSCQVEAIDLGGELVVNGDFSAGATGFTSGYIPGPGGTWGPLSLEGTYAVDDLANETHYNFAPCTDHSGVGNMMVVNGAEQAGTPIWCQSITVTPGTDYAFGAWLASMVSENPATLQFTINGEVIGAPFDAPFATCEWQQFHEIWSSGANTTAEICITNQNTVVSGNDFALDDISFTPFCVYTDEITVDFVDYPDPDMGGDRVVCGADEVLLDATTPGATSYIWNDGTEGPFLTVEENGDYWVHVYAAQCMGRDSVNVQFFDQPSVGLGGDVAACAGDSVRLDASTPGATYLWSDGSTGPTWSGMDAGEVWVQVAVGPCTASDTVSVSVAECFVEVVLPNIFTPNGDQQNQHFTPIVMKGVRTLTLEVFNRWGQEVYSTSSVNFAWTGRSGSGSLVPDGTYYWTMTYTGNDETTGKQSGSVTVVR